MTDPCLNEQIIIRATQKTRNELILLINRTESLKKDPETSEILVKLIHTLSEIMISTNMTELLAARLRLRELFVTALVKNVMQNLNEYENEYSKRNRKDFSPT